MKLSMYAFSVGSPGLMADPEWYVKYREADGRQTMVRARVTSKAKAREFLRRAEQNVDMGRVGVEKRGTERTFAELAAHWLKVHSATLTSHADNFSRMEHLTKAFGNPELQQAIAAERERILAPGREHPTGPERRAVEIVATQTPADAYRCHLADLTSRF